MKRRLFLSILFIIATIVTSLHEIKHAENHDSSSCQICIVDNHTLSADISLSTQEVSLHHFEAITLITQSFSTFNKKTSNHANAPPFLS